MKNQTREQRRQRTAALTVKAVVAVALIALWLCIASPILAFLAKSEPEEPTPEEMAARFAAQEEYHRLLAEGISEWSAQEAARLVLESHLGESGDGQ